MSAPDEVTRALQGALSPLPEGVVAVYLFGSVARGTASAESDVDLGLLYETPPPPTYQGQPYLLQANLSERLGRAVDLVVLNDAPVDLVHRVLRDGVLLFDTKKSVRIAFEVKARNEYFDLLPYLEEYRRPKKVS
jgi:predicted nucleotidyltransferase